MKRRNAIAAGCAAGIVFSAVAGHADKRKPTAALYQHFDQSSERLTVTDRLILHPDGCYDQTKQTQARAKSENVSQSLAPSLTKPEAAHWSEINCDMRGDRLHLFLDDTPHGNPPKSAGVQAWKNPSEYWEAQACLQPRSTPLPCYDTSPTPKEWRGTWRLLDKPGGAVLPLPSNVGDLPQTAVVEFSQAMPLGPIVKQWVKADLVLPAKEFDYYHSY